MNVNSPSSRQESAEALHWQTPLLLLLLLFLFHFSPPLLQLPRLQPADALRLPPAAMAVVRCSRPVSPSAAAGSPPCCLPRQQHTPQQQQLRGRWWQQKLPQQQQSEAGPLRHHEQQQQQQQQLQQQQQQQQQQRGRTPKYGCLCMRAPPVVCGAPVPTSNRLDRQHSRTTRGRRRSDSTSSSSSSTCVANHRKRLSSSESNNSNSTATSEEALCSNTHSRRGGCSSSNRRSNRTINTKDNSSSRWSNSNNTAANGGRLSSTSSRSSPSVPHVFPTLLCLLRLRGDDAAIACESTIRAAAAAAMAVPHAHTAAGRPSARQPRPSAINPSYWVHSLVSCRHAKAVGFVAAISPAALQLPGAASATICCITGSESRKSCLRCGGCKRRKLSRCCFCCIHEHSASRRTCPSSSTHSSSSSYGPGVSVLASKKSRSSSSNVRSSGLRSVHAFSRPKSLRCRKRGTAKFEGSICRVESNRGAATCGEEISAGRSADAAAAKVAAVENAFLSVVRSARVWLASRSTASTNRVPAAAANAVAAAVDSSAAAAGGTAAANEAAAADLDGCAAAATRSDASEAFIFPATAAPGRRTPAASFPAAAGSSHDAWKQLQEAVNTFHRVAREALGVPTQQLQDDAREKEQSEEAGVALPSLQKRQQQQQQRPQRADLQQQVSLQSQQQSPHSEQQQAYQKEEQEQQQQEGAHGVTGEERAVTGTHQLREVSSTNGSPTTVVNDGRNSKRGHPQKKNKKRCPRGATDSSSTGDDCTSNSNSSSSCCLPPLVWYDEGRRKLMVDRQQLLREKGESSRGNWSLRFLGTGSMQSSLSRNTSAILFTKGDGVSWLFDCGGGPSAATLPPPSSSPFRSQSSRLYEQIEEAAAGRGREANGEKPGGFSLGSISLSLCSASLSSSPATTEDVAVAHTEAAAAVSPEAASASLHPAVATAPLQPEAATLTNVVREAGTTAAPPPLPARAPFMPSCLQPAKAVACTSAAAQAAASEAGSTGVGSRVAAAGGMQQAPAVCAALAAAALAADSAATAAPVLPLAAADVSCSTIPSSHPHVVEDTPQDIATAAAIAVAAAAIRGAGKADAAEDVDIHAQPRKKRVSRIAAVFITHLHGDHVLGLPSLLSQIAASPALQLQECGRKQLDEAGDSRRGSETQSHARLHAALRAADSPEARGGAALSTQQHEPLPIVEIYGPQGLRSLLRAIFLGTYVRRCAPYRVHEFTDVPCLHHSHSSGHRCHYPVLPELPQTPFEAEGGRNIPARADGAYEAHEETGAKVLAVPIRHIVPTVGYVVEETGQLRRHLKAAALSPLVKRNAAALALLPSLQGQPKAVYKVLSSLAPGESYTFPDGTVLQHQDAFEAEVEELRKFCVCLDTCDASSMATYIRNCDLMIHESTLCETGRARGSNGAMDLDAGDVPERGREDCKLGPDYRSSSNNSGGNEGHGREDKKCIWETTRGMGRRCWSAADEEAFPRGHSTAALAGE